MARLPVAADFDRLTPTAAVTNATYTPRGGDAQVAMGKALGGVADMLTAEVDKQQKEQDDIESAHVNTEMTLGYANMMNELQNDPDYKNIPDKYIKNSDKLINTLVSQVSPRNQQKTEARLRQLQASSYDNVLNIQRTKHNDYLNLDFARSADELGKKAESVKSKADFDLYFKPLEEKALAATNVGAMKQEEAYKQLQMRKSNAAENWAINNPDKAIAALTQQNKNNSPNQTITVGQAISAQESGNNPNIGKSIDGAIGKWQIMPDTFKRFAIAGEDINNPKDNEAVGNRIIAEFNKKYNNDPARVAVAYFSGEGNVAPEGSPTPWKEDRKDGNGKSVSSYVGDVINRMGGNTLSSNSPLDYVSPDKLKSIINSPKIQDYKTRTLADSVLNKYQTNTQDESRLNYLAKNYSNIIQSAKDAAQLSNPDDIVFADKVVSRVEQYINQEMKAEEFAHKADGNLVMQAYNGTLSNGQKPYDIESLRKISPEVSKAWDRLIINNPKAAEVIENKILTANSKETDKDIKEGGDKFYDFYKRAILPIGDPKRPSVLDVQQAVGDGLTLKGHKEILSVLDSKDDGNEKLINNAVDFMKSRIVGLGMANSPENQQALSKATLDMRVAYQQGIAAGKKPESLTDPTSKDFIGLVAKNLVLSDEKIVDSILYEKKPEVSSVFGFPLPLVTFFGNTVTIGEPYTSKDWFENNFEKAVKDGNIDSSNGWKALNEAVKTNTISKDVAIKLRKKYNYSRPSDAMFVMPNGNN
jgi:hypothetical protein